MARLPDASDLGARPTPQNRRSIAVVRNAGAVADAVGGIGDTAQRIGDQMLEREDKLSYAAAKTTLLKADAIARQSLQDDPNYDTYETRYQETMGKAREQAASQIKSKFDRRLFEVDTSMDLERGRMEVSGMAKQRQKATRLSVLQNSLSDLQAVGRAAKDQATRTTTIKTAHDLVDAAIAGGDIDPLKGGDFRRQWASDYSKEQIAVAIDKGDLVGAQGLMDELGKNLESDDYIKLSAALHDEDQGQKVLAAADTGMGSPLIEAPKDVPGLVKSIFPNAVITSQGKRGGALAAENPRSYHNIGQAMDVRPVAGMTFEEFRDGLKEAGVPLIEAINEVTNPSENATGPHWHFAWTNRKSAPPDTVDEAIGRSLLALKMRNPNPSAQLIDKTRSEVLRRWQTKESSERDAEDNTVESVQAALIKNGGSWYALPASVRQAVNPKYVPGLIDFGEGLRPTAAPRKTDPSTYVKVSDLAATNPGAFAKINPIEYRDRMDDGDWNRMVDMRSKILGKSDDGAGGDASSVSAVRSVTAPLLAARGLTLTGKKAGSEIYARTAGRIYAFDRAIQDDLTVWRQNNPGKVPDAEVVQKIADRRTAEAINTKGQVARNASKDTLLQFEVGNYGTIQMPERDRQRIIGEMTPILGRRPSVLEVQQTWIAEARGG